MGRLLSVGSRAMGWLKSTMSFLSVRGRTGQRADVKGRVEIQL
jgi:hypothetical protein